MRIKRLLRTVSYLKPQQVFGRFFQYLPRPVPRRKPVPTHRSLVKPWIRPITRSISMLAPARVRFLGREGDVALAAHWNDPTHEKLWLYNLHYFDDLNAVDAFVRTDWHRTLLRRWVDENPPGQGNGWEPYPTSLRIVNWIKWALQGSALEAPELESLAVQARWLMARVEWHLLGNHLLANAKALVFVGLFFDGPEADRWLACGLEIYRRQLAEQILPDGGHFERSPMYHSIILEDLLDLLNVGRTYVAKADARIPELTGLIAKMRYWLRVMTLGDGRIAFFNDSAFGASAEPFELEEYANRLSLPKLEPCLDALIDLRPSGYARLALGDAVVIVDMAPVGPDYLPGHAHADTLSLEFSLGNERVIVNGGTSVYGTGPQRTFERSTAAHSTVEIDGENSSEVWAGFRVGRRARVGDISTSVTPAGSCVSASHDGYAWRAGRPIHRRSCLLRADGLTVTDEIQGEAALVVARFHLGPGVVATGASDSGSGILQTALGRQIRWTSPIPVRIAPSSWHPEFGREVETCQLELLLGRKPAAMEFRW